MGYVVATIITVLAGLIINYLALPVWALNAPSLWLFILALIAIWFISFMMISEFEDDIHPPVKIIMIIITGACCLVLIGGIFGTPLFNARSYASQLSIENKDIDMLPTVDRLSEIPLMDTASATKLGDRQMGSLTDLVSQFRVSDQYYTIIHNDRVCKIAPLEYAGFFKYNSNKYNGIPGYIIVDTETSEAKYIALDKGYHISNSAYFGNDLNRMLHKQYPSLIFGNKVFQIDEDQNPYWVAQVISPFSGIYGRKVTGAVIMDAVTGNTDYYTDLNSVPEWVDYVVDGNTISKYYDWKGDYTNGFWNSVFSQRGVTNTTDDFGYIAKDGDIWVYTGVTSVNNDESNLGFLMVNSRNMDAYYVQCDGAEEYSAMGAAEGAVQNFGYNASFPALVLFDKEPTYAMVLKDANGLVKLYAFVNVRNYSIVTTGATIDEAANNYQNVLSGKSLPSGQDQTNTGNTSVSENDASSASENANILPGGCYIDPLPEPEFTNHETIVVDSVEEHMIAGYSWIYLRSGDVYYKQRIDWNDWILFTQPGDKVILATETHDESSKTVMCILTHTLIPAEDILDEHFEDQTDGPQPMTIDPVTSNTN